MRKMVILAGVLSLLLTACGSVEPTVGSNWDVKLSKAEAGDGSELWQHRFKQGMTSIRIEKHLLYDSKLTEVVAWRTKLDAMKGMDAMAQLQAVQALVERSR